MHVFPVTQHMAAMAPHDFISEDLSVGNARRFDVGWSSALCALYGASGIYFCEQWSILVESDYILSSGKSSSWS